MDNTNPKVKISDIAKKAGVSAGTVDRVIHNRGEVAQKTSEKVLAILREMNYEPDILASALASKKNLRFASLIPKGDKWNPFWISPAEGLQQGWEEIRHFGIGYDKHFFTYHDRAEFEKKLRLIIDTQPSGLVLAPIFTEQTIELMGELTKAGIPVVFLNTQLENLTNIAFVGQNPGFSGKVAAKLLQYGLMDGAEVTIFNILSEKGGNRHILSREKGFLEYFEPTGPDSALRLKTINCNAQKPDNIFETLDNQLGHQSPPPKTKGIFVTNSKVFLVAKWLQQNNLENYVLIGYDLLPESIDQLKNGTISFLISQQPIRQGYFSMMTLFNYLVMKKQITKNQYLPIDIITKENIDFYLNH